MATITCNVICTKPRALVVLLNKLCEEDNLRLDHSGGGTGNSILASASVFLYVLISLPAAARARSQSFMDL